MSRTISANLKAHYAEHITTIARCWKITRTDAVEFNFTDHDSDIVYDGDAYKSLESGQTTAMSAKDDMSVDVFDIEIVLSASGIDGDDVKAKLFDHATIWVFELDYTTISDGVITLAYGRVGEIELFENYVRVEFRSLSEELKKNIGRSYLNECDAQFGDSRCGLDLDSEGYTSIGTVNVVTDRANFSTSGAGGASYTNGRIEFTSGANDGLTMEIKSWSSNNMVLVLPMPFNPANGDAYKAYYGCGKTLAICRDTYDNVVNYRGFPHLPGTDAMLDYPDAE